MSFDEREFYFWHQLRQCILFLRSVLLRTFVHCAYMLHKYTAYLYGTLVTAPPPSGRRSTRQSGRHVARLATNRRLGTPRTKSSPRTTGKSLSAFSLKIVETNHGCQMAIVRFLDRMCLALLASGLWFHYATLQNLIPSFPWIAPPRPPPWRNPRKGRDQILPSGNTDQVLPIIF